MTVVEAPPLTLGELAGHLSAFLERFEVGELSTSDAAVVAARFGRIKRMALTGEILCLNRAAASSAVRRRDDRDGAKWAGQQLGTTPGHAAELLKLADGLDAAPHTRDALLHGEVSAEQAAEVVRTETSAPGSEADMLDQAGRGSLTELKRRGRKVRAAAIGPERQAEQIHRGRYLRAWTDDDGAGRGMWSVPAAEQAELLAALAPVTDRIFEEARKEGRHEPVEAYRADALVRLATGALTAPRAPTPAGRPAITGRPSTGTPTGGPDDDPTNGPDDDCPGPEPDDDPIGASPTGASPTGASPTGGNRIGGSRVGANPGDGTPCGGASVRGNPIGDEQLTGQLTLVEAAPPDLEAASTGLDRGVEKQPRTTGDRPSTGLAEVPTSSPPSSQDPAQRPPPRPDPGHPDHDPPPDPGPDDPGPEPALPPPTDPDRPPGRPGGSGLERSPNAVDPLAPSPDGRAGDIPDPSRASPPPAGTPDARTGSATTPAGATGTDPPTTPAPSADRTPPAADTLAPTRLEPAEIIVRVAHHTLLADANVAVDPTGASADGDRVGDGGADHGPAHSLEGRPARCASRPDRPSQPQPSVGTGPARTASDPAPPEPCPTGPDLGGVAEVVGVGPVPVAQVRTWMRQGAFVAVIVTGPDPHDVHTVVHLGRRSALVDHTWLPDQHRPRTGPQRDIRAAHVKVLVGLTDADLAPPDLTALAAAVATRGVPVATLLHRGRHPNAAQRSALQWRSPECVVTGCANRIRLEADHVVEWRLTHHTTLGELEHLCRHHHRMKTHDGYRLEPGTGKRRLLPPPDP